MTEAMYRTYWRRPHRVATWVLALALASVSSVVCLAGSWQVSTQDECRAAMAQGHDSHSTRLDCCVTDAPNSDVSLAGIATAPPSALTLVAADPSGAPLSSSQSHPDGPVDSGALQASSTPTYLLVSVFRI